MEKYKRITVTLPRDLEAWLQETHLSWQDSPGVSFLVRRALRHYKESGQAEKELSGMTRQRSAD